MEGTQRQSFVVDGRLLSGKQTTVELGGHPTSPLVSDLKTLFGQSEGIPPEHMRLVHAGRVLEDSRTLASYNIASHDLVHITLASREDPFYPLAPLPTPDEDVVDTATAFTTPAARPIVRRRKEIQELLHSWPEQEQPLVYLWRVGRKVEWVELVVEGPPNSFYHGGAFLLRASYPPDYPFRPFALRMLTPLYHPTVGPQGTIAVLGHDPLHRWNPTHMIVAAVQDFIKQLEVYALSPVASDRLRHEIAQVAPVVEEWESRGEEWAANTARLWTQYYATGKGRIYRERAYVDSGQRCSSMAHLGRLVAVDETRLNNEEGIDDAERKKEPRLKSLGQLPRELVHMLLLCLGSHRRPPSPPDVPWKQLNNGDDVSGKAHLLGRLLLDCGAFDRRVVERFMGSTSDLYSRSVPARRRLEGLIRTREELARGITLATRFVQYLGRFRIRTKRYPFSLVNVPSLGFFERSCITGAANADFALMVVSAAALEFEACMADRKAKSLFEVALVAKGWGIEQLVVVLTKADEVLKELKPGQGTREHQALIEDRERRVVALLLSMQFKRYAPARCGS
ncbi:ubiquitin domain containing protein [Acanthamoeba castellanii str. Neff]|uniref:Ubiquitin domain containing protein n=1 Tax=Acanthamoeba castellanii (strain ATCC 30010 / Neff) TaxID=1257118 RepID=L8HC06_ACACF|nr:ubiquitin domain containing protein [Acanthamoeba castellanii str. Neff]ELR23059.1 ubiquitin domain containing protein [Acanthamoeba castellanii str. Neff]